MMMIMVKIIRIHRCKKVIQSIKVASKYQYLFVMYVNETDPILWIGISFDWIYIN